MKYPFDIFLQLEVPLSWPENKYSNWNISNYSIIYKRAGCLAPAAVLQAAKIYFILKIKSPNYVCVWQEGELSSWQDTLEINTNFSP